MLTDNISVFYRLIKDSIGIVKYLDRRSRSICSTIYVTFHLHHLKAKDSLKNTGICGDLKACVLIHR